MVIILQGKCDGCGGEHRGVYPGLSHWAPTGELLCMGCMARRAPEAKGGPPLPPGERVFGGGLPDYPQINFDCLPGPAEEPVPFWAALAVGCCIMAACVALGRLAQEVFR